MMITEVHDNKKYTGRNSLDIAMMVADDRRDAERQVTRRTRLPRKCSCRDNIFRL